MKFIRWIVQLDSKRRLVIPSNACSDLGISPRQRIEVIKKGEELIISGFREDESDLELRSISRNTKEVIE